MEQNKSIGRPGIEPQRYHNQIQQWLNDGMGIDAITATMLQKAIGGQYKKAVTILDEFKAGYETKELSELPEPPEQLSNALNAASLEIWRLLWNQKNTEVNAARSEFEQEKSGLMSLAAERLELIDNLENQLEQLRQQVTQLQNQSDDDRRQLSDTRERLATETTRREALEDKLKDKEQQLTESKQATEQANQKLVAAQRQHEDTVATMKQLGDEVLANLKQEHVDLVESLNQKHDEQLAALNVELDGVNTEHQKTTSELAEHKARADKAESQLDDTKMKLVDVNELRTQESKRADKQIADLQTRLDANNEKLTSTTAELAAANQRAEDATLQMDKAEGRAAELQSELVSLTNNWQQAVADSKKKG